MRLLASSLTHLGGPGFFSPRFPSYIPVTFHGSRVKIYPDCLEFSLLDELPIQGLRLSSSRLLAHSWGLGLQSPGHIYTPVGHACRASGGLVTSETFWFSLGTWGTSLPSVTSKRNPYLATWVLLYEGL